MCESTNQLFKRYAHLSYSFFSHSNKPRSNCASAITNSIYYEPLIDVAETFFCILRRYIYYCIYSCLVSCFAYSFICQRQQRQHSTLMDFSNSCVSDKRRRKEEKERLKLGNILLFVSWNCDAFQCHCELANVSAVTSKYFPLSLAAKYYCCMHFKMNFYGLH